MAVVLRSLYFSNSTNRNSVDKHRGLGCSELPSVGFQSDVELRFDLLTRIRVQELSDCSHHLGRIIKPATHRLTFKKADIHSSPVFHVNAGTCTN